MMNTYCPACGINVATEFKETPKERAWHCATCGLVLKKELVGGEPPLRAALSKPLRSTLRAAPAAARQSPLEAAPKPAAKPVDAIDLGDLDGGPGEFVIEAGGGERRVEAAVGQPAALAAPAEQVDFEESDPGDFVIEAGGGERHIEAARAAPEPVAGELLDLADDASGEFTIEAGGGERRVGAAAASAQAARAAPPARTPAPSGKPAIFDFMVVAEQDAAQRDTFAAALRQAGIGRDVRPCANGEQLLQTIAEQFSRGAPVGLVVLDAELPMINGFFAAVALRAFERGLGVPPTPLVFFSAVACDDAFRQVLDYSQPARYLHKGADPTPQGTARRLAAALSTLRH